MKKKLLIYCLILCCILPIQKVFGETFFRVEAIDQNAQTTLIAQVSTWDDAQRIYNENEDKHTNLLIKQDERIFKVKYGFLAFHKSETCDVNISFQQGSESGYTNGCYGIDAAYLSTSEDGNQVSFLLSGAYGTANIDDVDIYPIETNKRISSYTLSDGKLYHQIKTDISHELYSSSIYLGDAPEYLSKDMSYFSFDGHYFYQGDTIQGYYTMIDDLRSATYANAINEKEPYYNYYQYVSHRTKTAYSEAEINTYLDDTLHIQSPLTTYKSIGTSYHGILTQSMLKSQANAFLQYQDQFGANALMMMALSMNESATGKSYLAYTRNNVFGHAAFDSAVEDNASRYTCISSSIYSHAKHYISNSYLNPERFQYHGGYFGNKASGMNVSYASDPYWGEKAAQYYTRLDEALGGKDINAYALGIISQNREVNVYAEPTRSSTRLYTNNSLRDFAFILLEKQGSWYKIQSDPAANEDGQYMFLQDIGYVSAQDIDLLFNEENMKIIPSYEITFDANGGTFQGDIPFLTLQIEKNRIPSITSPQKDGALFIGWDKELCTVESATKYTAQYKNVKEAEVVNMKKTTYTNDEQLDVSGASLKITFQDNEVMNIPINSSMVSNFDTEIIGQSDLLVTYEGIFAEYPINIQEVKIEEQANLLNQIELIIANIDDSKDITSSQKAELFALKQEIDQGNKVELSYSSYRKLDSAIQKAYGASLQILVHGDMDAQVSGLSIATPLTSPTFFPSTLKFNVANTISNTSQTMLSNIAQANEYTPESFFELSGNLNFKELQLQDDIIISIKKPENTEVNLQYLIMQYKDDNVYQIPTGQSNSYITFSSDSLGEFALVSRKTANIYGDNDVIENNYKVNNGYDIFKIFFYILCTILLSTILILTIIIRRKQNSNPYQKRKRMTKDLSSSHENTLLSKSIMSADEEHTININDEEE